MSASDNGLPLLLSVENMRRAVSCDSASIGRRLQDLGFEPGAGVVCVLEKGKNGISAFLIKGAVIALRKEDADLILVEESE